ncbi:hypothetical protein BH20ACI2_BH20ACI2_28470 [soil metagenome]
MKRVFALLICLGVLGCLVYGQTRDEWDCPRVEVEGPAGITRQGDPMVFEAKVAGMAQNLIEYEWSVSNGEITEGQGTAKIVVVGAEPGTNVTATVRIKGLPSKCTDSASETARVMVIGGNPILDEYGKISWNGERGRLDNMLFQIKLNPGSTGLLWIYLDKNQTVDSEKKHLAKIVKHFRGRDKKFDLGRLVFMIQKSNKRRSTIQIVPAGEDLTACIGCTIINAKALSL